MKKSDVTIEWVREVFGETLKHNELKFVRKELKIFRRMTDDEVEDALGMILDEIICKCGRHSKTIRHKCGTRICEHCAPDHICLRDYTPNNMARLVLRGGMD